jgi:hypothetical protein
MSVAIGLILAVIGVFGNQAIAGTLQQQLVQESTIEQVITPSSRS